MAILYGTTGDGETLKVLVDQFGNLLAKGIDGQPGEQGPPGADGGDFPLPPDPYEGAFLGWLNNELAWVGTPPVPIPEGVFGPITGWDPGGMLTVQGDIPSQIGTGVFLYQCNADGSIFVDGWDTSQNWSSTCTGQYDDRGYSPEQAFNGDTGVEKGWIPYGTPVSVWTPQVPIKGIYSFRIRASRINNAGNTVKVTQTDNSVVDISTQIGTSNSWNTITGVTSIKSMEFKGVNNSTTFISFWAFEINGATLVDSGEYPTAPNLNFRVQSVSGQNLIGTANRTNDFSIGKYLRVPEQNVARWLYDGNLDKVITTTGIDISRLTGT